MANLHQIVTAFLQFITSADHEVWSYQVYKQTEETYPIEMSLIISFPFHVLTLQLLLASCKPSICFQSNIGVTFLHHILMVQIVLFALQHSKIEAGTVICKAEVWWVNSFPILELTSIYNVAMISNWYNEYLEGLSFKIYRYFIHKSV